MTWILVGTVLATILIVLVALNFSTPEKKLEKKIGWNLGRDAGLAELCLADHALWHGVHPPAASGKS